MKGGEGINNTFLHGILLAFPAAKEGLGEEQASEGHDPS